MTPPKSPQAPYKGHRSYETEDEALFFGRREETRKLIDKILSRRFTLLHAPSGAGKTSLLNAKIIPGLEKKGWTPITTLLGNDPLQSIRITTLQYLLPPPAVEYKAVKALYDELAQGDEDCRLGDLLQRYRENLPIYDVRKRTLIAPIKLEESPAPGIFPPHKEITTYFHRLLRASVSLETFAEHIAALERGTDLMPRPTPLINAETPVPKLLERLCDPALEAAYRNLLQFFILPDPNLVIFFEKLSALLSERYTEFTLVLILDQFEELYTRFIDPGVARSNLTLDLPDWRLKHQLFKELKALYTYYTGAGFGQDSRGSTLPIRFVVSMRDEYIAGLIYDVRGFVDNLHESIHSIGFLKRHEAEEALRKPALAYEADYPEDTISEILSEAPKGLLKENRFIEPVLLQIVCDKIWSEEGRASWSKAKNDIEAAPAETKHFIGKKTLGEVGGVEDLLKKFFDDFLENELVDEGENLTDEELQWRQLEVLEMLEPLITSSGTRNIVLRDELTGKSFRKNWRGQGGLERLEGRIVRTRNRLGGDFVEITHEFLIAPILKKIKEELLRNKSYTRFREALREFGNYESINFRVPTELRLSKETFRVLHKHHDSIIWPEWGVELMLRCALLHQESNDADSKADTDAIRYWADQFEQIQHPESALDVLDKIPDYEKQQWTLRLGELWLLNDHRTTLDTLSPDQLDYIVRSYLYEADTAERPNITFWIRQLLAALEREGVDEPTQA